MNLKETKKVFFKERALLTQADKELEKFEANLDTLPPEKQGEVRKMLLKLSKNSIEKHIDLAKMEALIIEAEQNEKKKKEKQELKELLKDFLKTITFKERMQFRFILYAQKIGFVLNEIVKYFFIGLLRLYALLDLPFSWLRIWMELSMEKLRGFHYIIKCICRPTNRFKVAKKWWDFRKTNKTTTNQNNL